MSRGGARDDRRRRAVPCRSVPRWVRRRAARPSVASSSSEARQRARNRSNRADRRPRTSLRRSSARSLISVEHQRLHVLGPAAGQTAGQRRELVQEDVEVARRRGEVAEPLQLRCHPGDQGGRQDVAEQLDRRATPPDRDPEVVQELDVDVRHGAVPGGLHLVEEGHQHPGHRHAGGQPGLHHRPRSRRDRTPRRATPPGSRHGRHAPARPGARSGRRARRPRRTPAAGSATARRTADRGSRRSWPDIRGRTAARSCPRRRATCR